MIISHKYKFIFIKTTKTAGTSIEVFLSGHCADEDIVTPIIPAVDGHRPRNYESGRFFNHISGAEIRERIGPEVWDGYFKFCFERNPWDKVLSHYHMLRARAGGELMLDQYFRAGGYPRDTTKYLDKDRRILVDRICRYEDLTEELSAVCSQLGMPFSGQLQPRAKSEYRTDRRHYRDVLSTEQARIVSEQFAFEIAEFGYRF